MPWPQKKESPSRCCRPETARPSETGSKKTTVCRRFTSTTTASAMPVLRRPAGGDLQGVGWWSLRGEKEACGRCCRSVRLSVFLVRYVWLIECYWNDLNSFTAENICAGWFSHSKYRLIHVCTKITRDLKSTKIWLFDVWLKCRSIVENLQREREIGSVRNCATVDIGNCSWATAWVFLRSLPQIRDNARHYQIHLLRSCASVWNEPLRFLLVTEYLTFNPFFTQQYL